MFRKLWESLKPASSSTGFYRKDVPKLIIISGIMLLYWFVRSLLAQVPRWRVLPGQASLLRVLYPLPHRRFDHLPYSGGQDTSLGQEGKIAWNFILPRAHFRHFVHHGDDYEVDWFRSLGLFHRVLDNPRFHHCCNFMDRYRSVSIRGRFSPISSNLESFETSESHLQMGINESSCQCAHSLYSGHWKRHHGLSIVLASFRYYGCAVLRWKVLLLWIH